MSSADNEWTPVKAAKINQRAEEKIEPSFLHWRWFVILHEVNDDDGALELYSPSQLFNYGRAWKWNRSFWVVVSDHDEIRRMMMHRSLGWNEVIIREIAIRSSAVQFAGSIELRKSFWAWGRVTICPSGILSAF